MLQERCQETCISLHQGPLWEALNQTNKENFIRRLNQMKADSESTQDAELLTQDKSRRQNRATGQCLLNHLWWKTVFLIHYTIMDLESLSFLFIINIHNLLCIKTSVEVHWFHAWHHHSVKRLQEFCHVCPYACAFLVVQGNHLWTGSVHRAYFEYHCHKG